ncbi:MAG TPA: hypothetical protein VGS05_16520 [Candidatus Sulfotelmatobacter sp.]|nr:hypothetical protein [Candidatus Sulfotelmatobacter sp.]
MLDGMALVSPTLEGFRAAFRRPSLTLGEIAWRWSVGGTATALFFFGVIEYLDSLPVTSREMLLLRTGQPYLVGQVLGHILRGSLGRAVLSAVLAAMLLVLLWIIAASLGRMATVAYLVDYFRERCDSLIGVSQVGEKKNVASAARGRSFDTLLRIHFLRAAVVLAALLCAAGAAILAGFASPDSNPRPGVAFVLFLALAVLIAFVAWALNWFLSLAAVLAVRDGEDAVSAMSAAAAMCRERTGAVFAVSSWTGLAHLAAFGAATAVAGVPLGLAGILPGRLILGLVMVVTVAYFAVADWLYMARLAGYVCIAEAPEVVQVRGQPPISQAPLETSIDRDEPILSDLPGLILES